MSHRQINRPEPTPVEDAHLVLLWTWMLMAMGAGAVRFLWETPRLVEARSLLLTHLLRTPRLLNHLSRLPHHRSPWVG